MFANNLCNFDRVLAIVSGRDDRSRASSRRILASKYCAQSSSWIVVDQVLTCSAVSQTGHPEIASVGVQEGNQYCGPSHTTNNLGIISSVIIHNMGNLCFRSVMNSFRKEGDDILCDGFVKSLNGLSQKSRYIGSTGKAGGSNGRFKSGFDFWWEVGYRIIYSVMSCMS